VTKVVNTLKNRGVWKEDELRVTLVPGGIETDKANPLTIEAGSNPSIGTIRLLRRQTLLDR